MRKTIVILIILTTSTLKPKAQAYIGSGQTNGITVETSNQHQDPNWSARADAINTINGSGNDFERNEAVRFLMQATLGFEKQHVEDVLNFGFEGWIDQQIQMPYNEHTMWDKAQEVLDRHLLDPCPDSNPDCFIPDRPPAIFFDHAYWDYTMKNEDLLRHRVALTLSEIFVINKDNVRIGWFGDTPTAYYDVLAKNALGNFEDLLLDVTLSPVMGTYLNHLGNKKTNLQENTFPDQNFAREVMQLFSIGLDNLNMDGSPITDANGIAVPTYNNQDVAEFAKVFTGLRIGAFHDNHWDNGTPHIETGLYYADARIPMAIVEDFHEPGSKNLLNGYVIPAGQTGMQDIEDAVHHLFMHPNVGPFIGKKLIQFLVKSNPSPQYIERISQVFNNNGNGVRGDMGAVVKAILLDEETRNCYGNTVDIDSKLKEPFVRYTHLLRHLPKSNSNNELCCAKILYGNDEGTKFPQYLLHAKSVFNFFQAHYAPNGCIAGQNLVAPEFQIHNSLSSVNYINKIDDMLRVTCPANNNTLVEPEVVLMHKYGTLENSSSGIVNYVFLNMDDYKNLANGDIEALINELDLYFAHGNLSHETRLYMREIISSINEDYFNNCYNDDDEWHLKKRVSTALFLMAVSPDYAIIR